MHTVYIKCFIFWGRGNPLKKLKIRIDAHMTLRERIVETIRNAIVNGQLVPGTRIAEPELADKFGISRTPIREAFRQLESEGFITVVPRKGPSSPPCRRATSPTSTT